MPFEGKIETGQNVDAKLDFAGIMDLIEALSAIEHPHTEYTYEEGGVIKVCGQGIWSTYTLDLITGTITNEEHSADAAPSTIETRSAIESLRTKNIEAVLQSITGDVLDEAA